MVRTLRQRALLIFPMIFPLILFAINGSALSAATQIPRFPTHNYRDFLIAMPFVQGAMFVADHRRRRPGARHRERLPEPAGADPAAGRGAARRPARRRARARRRSRRSSTCWSAWPPGSRSPAASAARSCCSPLSILIAFAFASLGGLLALRFGTGEAVQGIFPLLFVTLFLSSSSLPRNLIKATWFRDVATYNPVSYLLEGLRSLVITGWDAQALALGFGFALALLVLALGVLAARR